MGYRKYLVDYRTETRVLPNGKAYPEAVYVGKRFAYVLPDSALGRIRLRDAALTVLFWCLWLASLLLNTLSGRTYYTVLPQIGCFLPLVLLSWSVALSYLRAVPLKREDADGIAKRRCGASLALLLLSGVSLTAFAVLCVLRGQALFLPEDLLWGGCVTGEVLLSLFIYLKRSGLAVRELPDHGQTAAESGNPAVDA